MARSGGQSTTSHTTLSHPMHGCHHKHQHRCTCSTCCRQPATSTHPRSCWPHSSCTNSPSHHHHPCPQAVRLRAHIPAQQTSAVRKPLHPHQQQKKDPQPRRARFPCRCSCVDSSPTPLLRTPADPPAACAARLSGMMQLSAVTSSFMAAQSCMLKLIMNCSALLSPCCTAAAFCSSDTGTTSRPASASDSSRTRWSRTCRKAKKESAGRQQLRSAQHGGS